MQAKLDETEQHVGCLGWQESMSPLKQEGQIDVTEMSVGRSWTDRPCT